MKMKRLLGVLLTIVLMLGLLPGMGVTAYADVPQEGSNKYVGYRHNDNGFIVYGKREKADGTIEEIQTTWNNNGYTTVMKVGESGFIVFNDFAYDEIQGWQNGYICCSGCGGSGYTGGGHGLSACYAEAADSDIDQYE